MKLKINDQSHPYQLIFNYLVRRYPQLSGKPAFSFAGWFWGWVPVVILVGARNRLSVIFNWMWSYITFRANNLLIIAPQKHFSKKAARK